MAVLADRHGIPFYVVAPGSTSTSRHQTAGAIPIEGAIHRGDRRFPARNPAFDVTPGDLIDAIVTEAGAHRAPYSKSLAAAVPA